MNLKKHRFFHLVVLAFLFAGPAIQGALAKQSSGQIVGQAFGLKSGELLYSETHCGLDEDAREVFYQRSDGTLIAHKTLDYQSGYITPSFVQHNIQSSEKIEVSFDQGTVSMSVTASDKSEQENRYALTDIESKPVVIDAGFDGYIRDNWDRLLVGDTLEFQFPLASRSSMVSLRVKSSLCSYETDADQCFTLEASNWLYRILSSPIELGYDQDQLRLARYRGLSNINDERGKGLMVDIRYSYQVPAATTCDIDRPLLSENLMGQD
jgi:hypothetical protein